MKKRTKAWTLNKMYRYNVRFSISVIIWMLLCLIAIYSFSDTAVIYVALGLAVLGLILLLAGMWWYYKHWRCPKCGDHPAQVFKNRWGVPDYCRNCGEKIDGNAPIDIK